MLIDLAVIRNDGGVGLFLRLQKCEPDRNVSPVLRRTYYYQEGADVVADAVAPRSVDDVDDGVDVNNCLPMVSS